MCFASFTRENPPPTFKPARTDQSWWPHSPWRTSTSDRGQPEEQPRESLQSLWRTDHNSSGHGSLENTQPYIDWPGEENSARFTRCKTARMAKVEPHISDNISDLQNIITSILSADASRSNYSEHQQRQPNQ
ncbi:hypothetical protein DPEC_G00114000 [Dallia pectoralis]|uniref:Uncharacterized protein n=1 Tax=Dallia pectoralis TaxID=75939 RepID=A0ACC2GTK9_DALPE|nr:hypothetical protein DPEC_G00114000 [Dallia pectoralis]